MTDKPLPRTPEVRLNKEQEIKALIDMLFDVVDGSGFHLRTDYVGFSPKGGLTLNRNNVKVRKDAEKRLRCDAEYDDISRVLAQHGMEIKEREPLVIRINNGGVWEKAEGTLAEELVNRLMEEE